jgi:two-component system, cell cycle sensor histidine kinase and response regulator CckA
MAVPKAELAPVVLVVDDEPVVLKLMGHALAGAGYVVHVASNPIFAIDLLEQAGTPPAALVTDLRMHPLDGVALSRQVVAKWPGTRVLYVSGWDAEHLILEWPILRKPFSPEQLVEAVAHLLH